jgi:hypothetical protein
MRFGVTSAGMMPSCHLGAPGGEAMNASLLAALTQAERRLVAETEPAELAMLDEDAAIALEARIRRARGKYVGQYRRSASARVPEQGGRGMARPKNTHAAMKAEAFETALSRVSRRVGVLARESAARLRAERLEMARAAKAGRGPSSAGPSKRGAVPSARRAPKEQRALRTPASERERASTRAVNARRQVKRDSKRAASR